MKLEEIKEFLRNRPGYLKEGGKRLRSHLLGRGFTTTVNNCKKALREVRLEQRMNPVPKDSIKPKVLVYDIETSYGIAKAWRPGYRISLRYDSFITHGKIICVSYKWLGEDEVHTLRWDSNQDDKLLVENFIKVLNEADFSVAHYGDNFDIKTLKTRAIYHDIKTHPTYTTVDTVKIARSYFKFPSNRLDDIGDYLGLGRKIKTDFSLWDRVILERCPEAMEEMIKYCEQDVFLLEAVYEKLSEHMLPTIHTGTLHGKTKQTSPYNGGTNIELVKTTTTKAGTKKHLMFDKVEEKYFKMSNTDYKKFLEINK